MEPEKKDVLAEQYPTGIEMKVKRVETNPIDFDCLWQSSKNRDKIAEFLKTSLKPRTKKWILNHILPIPMKSSQKLRQESSRQENVGISNWLWLRKASIMIANGSQSLNPNSPLIDAFAQCLELSNHSAPYMFFRNCSAPVGLSDREVMDAFIFLVYANILIVLNEFQDDTLSSCIIKQMQDFHTDSTHDFGMLLYGSKQSKMTDEIFYCVNGVGKIKDSLPNAWLEYV
jgi:hypothetical protein